MKNLNEEDLSNDDRKCKCKTQDNFCNQCCTNFCKDKCLAICKHCNEEFCKYCINELNNECKKCKGYIIEFNYNRSISAYNFLGINGINRCKYIYIKGKWIGMICINFVSNTNKYCSNCSSIYTSIKKCKYNNQIVGRIFRTVNHPVIIDIVDNIHPIHNKIYNYMNERCLNDIN